MTGAEHITSTEIRISERDWPGYYLRAVTKNSFTGRQYQVLEACLPYPAVGTAEKKEIVRKLDISPYHLTNLLCSLKNAGELLYDENTRTYKSVRPIPENPHAIVVKCAVWDPADKENENGKAIL